MNIVHKKLAYMYAVFRCYHASTKHIVMELFTTFSGLNVNILYCYYSKPQQSLAVSVGPALDIIFSSNLK